jgi:hypothetical protein
MFPCQRCVDSTRGQEQCSYPTRYIPATSEETGTAATDSGYSTFSAITSALLTETVPRGAPSKTEPQPVTRHIISDSESDNDEIPADIVHEDEYVNNDTVEMTRTTRPAPTVRDSLLSLLKKRNGEATSNLRKRRASDTLHQPRPFDFQQPPQKRARRGSAELAWRPCGGARSHRAKSVDRAVTRLSTSTLERRSYARSPQFDGEDGNHDSDTVHPDDVPSTIREVFANMSQDVLLDIFPDGPSGRGSKAFSRIGVPMKEPGEYSMNPMAVRNRELRSGKSDAENLLLLRERGDNRALVGVMKSIREDDFSGWNEMSEAEQTALKEEHQREIQRQRDERGRSSNFYANQLLKLAVSCVGEEAMLRFLVNEPTARRRVVMLFEGLLGLEEDGRVRLRAGGGEEG